MLAELKGTVQNSRVVIDKSAISPYEGMPVIVRVLDAPAKAARALSPAQALANDSLVIPTEIGASADDYVMGLRANDRI